jgi:hypothetical protein
MTSEVLRKILVAGAAVAALSVVASRKREQGEQIPGGAQPDLRRIDPG